MSLYKLTHHALIRQGIQNPLKADSGVPRFFLARRPTAVSLSNSIQKTRHMESRVP